MSQTYLSMRLTTPCSTPIENAFCYQCRAKTSRLLGLYCRMSLALSPLTVAVDVGGLPPFVTTYAGALGICFWGRIGIWPSCFRFLCTKSPRIILRYFVACSIESLLSVLSFKVPKSVATCTSELRCGQVRP